MDIEQAFKSVVDNLQPRPVAYLLRLTLFAWGYRARRPKHNQLMEVVDDLVNHQLLAYRPIKKTWLCQFVYQGGSMGRLVSLSMEKDVSSGGLIGQIKLFYKRGEIDYHPDPKVMAQAALKKDLISKDEFEKAELFSRELKSLIGVDAFDRLD